MNRLNTPWGSLNTIKEIQGKCSLGDAEAFKLKLTLNSKPKLRVIAVTYDRLQNKRLNFLWTIWYSGFLQIHCLDILTTRQSGKQLLGYCQTYCLLFSIRVTMRHILVWNYVWILIAYIIIIMMMSTYYIILQNKSHLREASNHLFQRIHSLYIYQWFRECKQIN